MPVPEKSYSRYRDRTQDPYQNVYNEIANDLLAMRKSLTDRERAAIDRVSEMRFAAELVPEVFGPYVAKDKKDRYAVTRLPADDDPMLGRMRAVREREYTVLDTLECGIVLVGTEVKSLRRGTVSLDEGYAHIKNGEVYLLGCDIAEYVEANRFNHNPRRPRKLLMHRREIERLIGKTKEKGLTLVPTRLYFKDRHAKVEIALARGKDVGDKRQSIKERELKREMERSFRR